MNLRTKALLYVLLLVATAILGVKFREHYLRIQSFAGNESPSEPTDIKLPEAGKNRKPDRDLSNVIAYFGAFVAALVALGLMAARDVSVYAGARAVKAMYNDEGEGMKDPEYERAEEAWANGHHLEAIQMMRDYLKNNPREQHVALRIAEIYEKDLQNYLAAALEYEEVLQKKLAPEQWGWAAIHLCNLYSSKLNQTEKAVTLLRRIDTEYGETAAAEKARKRLALFDSLGAEALREESPTGPPSTSA